MKKLTCRDAGVDGCPWTVFGETDEAILARAREHDAERHPDHPRREDDRFVRQAIRTL